MLDAQLSSHLAGCTLLAEESVNWSDGRIQLRVRGYLADRLPPLEYITSARCLLFRHHDVLVQRDTNGTHVLPGGRRERGEPPEEALHREVLEETGWALQHPLLLGFLHFRHRTPKAPDSAYPYPEFVQAVFVADALRFKTEARLEDGSGVERRDNRALLGGGRPKGGGRSPRVGRPYGLRASGLGRG